jgi:hypothetical protein
MLSDHDVPCPHRHRNAQEDEPEAGDDFIPATHKLQFLTYDGKSDPLSWLNCCDHYFRLRPEDKKVAYAAFNLLDDAQLWYYRLELNGAQPTWIRFVQMVNDHFGPPLTGSPIGELAHLRCNGAVDDYCSKFMGLSCRRCPKASKFSSS